METVVLSKNDIKDTLLITHKNCMDGSGCAVIFMDAGGKEENIEYVTAGSGVDKFFKNNHKRIREFKYILLADVAPSRKYFDELEKQYSGSLIIIDHHLSASFLCFKNNCHIDTTKCGTYLLFEFLCPLIQAKEVARHFAELTNDRDMWICESVFASEMALLSSFIGQEEYVKKAIDTMFWDEVWEEKESYLISILTEKRAEYIANKIKDTKIIDTIYGKIAYIFASEHISDALNCILDFYGKDVDASIAINFETYTVSVRSKGNADDMRSFNSAEFCEKFGGGGHFNAAGHSISKNIILEIMEMFH